MRTSVSIQIHEAPLVTPQDSGRVSIHGDEGNMFKNICGDNVYISTGASLCFPACVIPTLVFRLVQAYEAQVQGGEMEKIVQRVKELFPGLDGI